MHEKSHRTLRRGRQSWRVSRKVSEDVLSSNRPHRPRAGGAKDWDFAIAGCPFPFCARRPRRRAQKRVVGVTCLPPISCSTGARPVVAVATLKSPPKGTRWWQSPPFPDRLELRSFTGACPTGPLLDDQAAVGDFDRADELTAQHVLQRAGTVEDVEGGHGA